jgi:hypothetical protein
MPPPLTVAVEARSAPSPIEHDARERLSAAVPAIAAIVHDPALLDDAEQIRAGGAVAALALENERLQAELRATVEELSASRARIVESGYAARRRLERDLRDGAQQRLVSIALSLRIPLEARGRSRCRAGPEREPARSISGRPHPSVSGSGVPLGGSGETAGETESGRAMHTRTIAIAALFAVIAIVVILFVL